ncbi:amino acid-binding ACT domain protein [Thermodesulfatator indicus DSM 15286]|uniref:Amino acid-binding ACT domain protein n=1 Tax=Thermodesulfatator indicus (strain DSM 15286 / JCM 11887 / CIR29812) TaxID=667014 RepID=F8A8Z1_THEID|nr:ACT domain-containing protein [Thermodesulfatator indicus]AEH44040.1 amino acid-binding ACT domain protein [Thermodesulfatator indicus DSM 15286]
MRGKYAIKQLSIFLENRKGRLKEVTRVLAEANVNIRALALAESAEFGILRLVVDNPEKARSVLSSEGFTVKEQEVFAVEVPDKPGGFYQVVKALTEADINIDYTYAFVGGKDSAILIFKVPDHLFEKALEVVHKEGIKLVEPIFFYGK